MKAKTIKVLVIDDDEDDYILTRDLFAMVEGGHYVIDWASSYDEGLAVAKFRGHDVCLVDYRLGEHNGVQLIREARAAQVDIPMILLTGQGDFDVNVDAMEAGVTDYLTKYDASPSKLEETIRLALRKSVIKVS